MTLLDFVGLVAVLWIGATAAIILVAIMFGGRRRG